jgi:amino acid adenylation domain-containing protein
MIPRTLGELLRDRAEEKGATRAYAALDDSAVVCDEISYTGLYRSALQVARVLQQRYERNSRVALVFPSGINFLSAFFGCALAGMISVPMAPPKRNRKNERFTAIARDASPVCMLTLSAWTELLRTNISDAGLTADVFSINDEEFAQCAPSSSGVVAQPGEIAYLQYTSGSIGVPKGVVVTHANILSNSAFMRYVEENDEQTISLTWLPNFHDMGLAEGLIQPLYSSVPGFILTPAEFLRRPLLWLEAITLHRVTVSGGPNFAFDMCVEKSGQAEEISRLDLSSWRVAYNGAEPIRSHTLNRFLQTFSPFGFQERAFYPVYGLAEATLVVTSGRREDLPFRLTVDRDQLEQGRIVPAGEETRHPQTLVASGSVQSGRVEHGIEVTIVDAASAEPLPDGVIGEVYIRGTSVAAGYWNRPQETAEFFAATIHGRGEERFARTGDLGFTWQGKLFLTGRSKDLIISKGRNIYPQDIEWLAESAHEAIRASRCAAFSERTEEGSEDRIAVVCEIKRNSLRRDLKEAAETVRERVSSELEMELAAVVLIPPGALPKTSSGKVQRALCRTMLQDGTLPVVFSWREEPRALEKALQDTASSAMRAVRDELATLLSGSAAVVSDDTPVFQYVRDSLHALRLCQEVERRFSVTLPLSCFLGESSIADLSRRIVAPKTEPKRELKLAQQISQPAPKRLSRLSYGQEALWFLAAIAPENTGYHISRALEISGIVDVPALRRSLDLLIARHAALRTRFETVEGVPHQAFDSSRTVLFECETFEETESSRTIQHLAESAWKPFHLEKDSLVRIHLFSLGSQRHLLLISMHHIVADLWAFAQFVDELLVAYQAFASGQWPSMPELRYDYPAFIEWQRSFVSSEEGQSLRDFWRSRLQTLPAATVLPLDRPRPARMSFKGGTVECGLDEAALAAIGRVAHEFRTTPFCIMLTAYLVFLHHASGQHVVTVGVPVSGRTGQEFAGTLGFVANTIVLSAEISPAITWRDLLVQTREQLVAAIDAADYPFALVADSPGVERDLRLSPVFQQMFSFDSLPQFEKLSPLVVSRGGEYTERSGLKFRAFALPQQGSQCDLHARFVQHEGRVLGIWHYDSEILEESTVRSWAGVYCELLREALANPQRRIAELPVAASEVRGLSGERVDWMVKAPTLPTIIEQNARQHPYRIALSFEDSFISYAELDRQADKVARWLHFHGVKTDEVVGVCLDRCTELLIVLLGILKAGAAYLTIATDYPARRAQQLINDAQPKALIVSEAHREQYGDLAVVVTDLLKQPLPGSASRRMDKGFPESAAYVIFTSGSTGCPKGVVNNHRGIMNRLLWMQRTYVLTPDDHVLQKTPYTFDVSVWEFFWPLLAGAQAIISRPGGHRDPLYLERMIQEREVTVVHFVPSMLALFLEQAHRESIEPVRLMFCSGEALPKSVEAAAFKIFNSTVHNLYGPTEAAVDVTAWQCDPEDRGATVPIGRPIANTTIRIFNSQIYPVIPGAAGDLYIAGIGLARGYIGRPDLTASVFMPDPYANEPGTRLYKTGDQARLRSDRAIEFLGRRDFQVKVRGFRVELQEIEAQLQAHPGIASAAVLAHQEDQFGARLAAYYVLHRNSGVTQQLLRTWLAERLPEYMVPAFFVELEEMPQLESGKVDRKALLVPTGVVPQTGKVPPRTTAETTLAEVWQEVLGVPSVSVTGTFFEMGGDSLSIVRAATKARTRGLNVTVESIYQSQTIRKICARLSGPATDGEEKNEYQPFSLVDPSELKRLPAHLEDAMPLARLQESIVYLIDNYENYIAYVASVHLRAPCRPDLWKQSIEVALAEHPYLRVSFAMKGFREPLQFVHHHVNPAMELHDIRHLAPEVQERYLDGWLAVEKKRRFDWGTAPFCRLTLHRRTDDTFQMTLTEVMLDGWSIAVLMAQLCRTYRKLLRSEAVSPRPANSTYGRFVQLERQAMENAASEEFWSNKLATASLVRLPRWPVKCRSTDRSLHNRHTVHVEAAFIEQLKNCARDANAPLKSVFLAVHLAVLRTLTGREQVLTEMILHGRPEETESYMAMGMYINTVPIQVTLSGMSWAELVQRCYQSETGLYPHRRYPFFEIRRRSGHPLLNETGFNFTHFHIYKDLLEDSRDLEVLSVQSFDQTYFNLTAYFNLLPVSNRLSIDLDYNPTELANEQVELIAGYYEKALQAIVASPQARIADALLLSRSELVRELDEWSVAPELSPDPPELLDVIYHHCLNSPDRIAIVQEGMALSYRQLWQRSSELERRLRRIGIGPEIGAGVLLDRSVEFVIALLAVLKCGGFFVPLDVCDPPERRLSLIRQSGVKVLIVREPGVNAAGVPEITCVDTTFIGGVVTEPRMVPPDMLAYCIYTSGSTGAPKGVEIPRRALSSFVQAAASVYALQPQDNLLQFASLCFDVAIEEIFCTLYAGARLVLRTDQTIESFDLFLDVCRREQLTVLDLPTAFWHQLTSVLKEGWIALPSCVRSVTTVGEKANPQRLADWREAVGADVEIYNAYGPTETTIVAVLHRMGTNDPVEEDFPIGRPLAGVSAYILGADGQPGPIGREGELCIAGGGLARGYHGRGDLTAERFGPNNFSGAPGSRMYWTGDFVTRRPDGSINFVGRKDAQSKVRGFRIEPAEIESALYRDARVKQAAVVARGQEGDCTTVLVAYVVPQRWIPEEASKLAVDLSRELARTLPAYMVPAHIELTQSLRLTSSGKIDQSALQLIAPPAKEMEQPSAWTSGKGFIEDTLSTIYRACLDVEDIPRDARFAALGGHSLSAMKIVSRIQERLHVTLKVRDIFESPGLAALAEHVQQVRRMKLGIADNESIRRAGGGEKLEMSFAQERLWFLQQFDPENTSYNVPAAFRIHGPLNVTALHQALMAICARHQVLQMRFVDRGITAEPVLPAEFTLPLERIDLRSSALVARQAEARRIALRESARPFDLTNENLIRVTLVDLDCEEYLLIVVMHHIVTDEWCTEIFMDEFQRFYQTHPAGIPAKIADLPIQYSDFARWQKEVLRGERLNALREFWLQELADAPPLLQLPLDFPREHAGSSRAERIYFEIPQELTRCLKLLGESCDASLFMVLLAVYQVLLHRVSGMDDIVIGTPIAGRISPDTEKLVGFFANLLVMRSPMQPHVTFASHLAEVRVKALSCYDHQEFSFAQLVSCLNPERTPMYAPIVQVIFGMWPQSVREIQVANLRFRQEHLYPQQAKYDLEMQIADAGEVLRGFLEYNAALFQRNTVAELVATYKSLCEMVVDNPKAAISELRQMAKEENRIEVYP